MLEDTLTVTNGRVASARRLDNPHHDADGVQPNRRWEITVEPDTGAGDVAISLPAAADCEAPGAVCTADGRALAGAVSATVPRSAAQAAVETPPLTASFSQVPAAHDGSGAFTFELRFSEAFPLAWRSMLEDTLTVTNGRVAAARRIDNPHHDADGVQPNRSWRITVEPAGYAAVFVTLPATTDCAAPGAVCTADERMLSSAVSATVQGPVTLSVADARVREAQGAVLGFTVSLSRAAADAVTVDYATGDGSATAGDDYTAASGTLTFAAGETAKTVEVAVLDDAHDEGEETLTLTLSNPSPSSVKLADASATGTIENTDLMPQAWISRFGRTVAEQVLGAVETRMRAPRTPGAEVSLAGRRIGLGPLFGADAAPAKRARETGAEAEEGQRRLAAWLRGAAEEEERPSLETQTVTERDLLFGSSFALTAEAGGPGSGAGAVAVWGRGAVSRFDGQDGELTVDGEVASAMLGADWSRGRAMAGLIIGHSIGEGGYRAPSGGGVVSSTLTGLYPWGRYALSERVELWGAAGYGEGTLTLTPEGQDAMRTDLDLWMAAAGLRGVLLDGGEDGLTLAAKTDAMTVTTASDATAGLAASEGGVTRLRLALEGS